MTREHLPGLQTLLHAFKRFARASGTAVEARDAAPETSLEADGDRAADSPSGVYAAAAVTTPITVVIADCRGPEAAARCLAAVLAQRFDAASFEVIVVDDSGRDELRGVVAALTPVGRAPTVRHLRVPRAGAIAARNEGWRAAHGVIVAFTDDRQLPDPDWLAGGERAMRAGHVVLGRSVCVPASKPDAAAEALCRLQNESAFVRRDALERVGGFDERYATA